MRPGRARALRQFTLSTGKSAGRNFSGRYGFHRGVARRLLRRIDLKRSTSSMGIVESIEYDPNRSSQIAPVRWIKGLPEKMNTIEELAPRKILESTTNTISGLFCSLSCREGGSKKGSLLLSWTDGAYVVVGLPTECLLWRRKHKTLVKDVFFSAFSSPMAKRETASLAFASSFGFPRIAVAGVPTAFLAPNETESERKARSLFARSEVENDSILWAHRIKGKAGLSWQSFRRQDTLGLVGAAGHNKSKLKTDQGSLPAAEVSEATQSSPGFRAKGSQGGASGRMLGLLRWKRDRRLLWRTKDEIQSIPPFKWFLLLLVPVPNSSPVAPNVWHFPCRGCNINKFAMIKLQPKIYDHIMLTVPVIVICLPEPRGLSLETFTNNHRFLMFFPLLTAALSTPPDNWCQIAAGVQNQLGLTSEERLMLANLRVRAARRTVIIDFDGSDPRESGGELLVLEWESRAPKSRVILLEIGPVVTSLAGSSIRNGPVSLNPATGLSPAISSMVRLLVICLTHASEVRGAAKPGSVYFAGFSSSFAEEARFLQELKTKSFGGLKKLINSLMRAPHSNVMLRASLTF
ncbi:hypothetical protein Bca52824_064351 [Brassica carinata]|uniref:Large ribosomal subunit protein uL2 RNA-binding domain-containing protein n=1 Tax=Brassica carinata TaxID=52824 RepID=A0A8X7UBA2_BRACI|nr:hypothetical protein Bca52824_064351 [Brassica carinata]